MHSLPNRPRTALLLAIVCLTFNAADAKRGPPPDVKPMVIDSVSYSAPPDPQLMGIVIATKLPSGKELWRQRIYSVALDPFLETDVQWVFITSLLPKGHSLLITDERNRHYRLDLTTRKVTKER